MFSKLSKHYAVKFSLTILNTNVFIMLSLNLFSPFDIVNLSSPTTWQMAYYCTFDVFVLAYTPMITSDSQSDLSMFLKAILF